MPINGTALDDIIIGTANADIINGFDGNDFLSGEAANDTINGGNGNDTLLGGDGADTLNGEADNDILYGGVGADTMNGGFGNDTYVVDNAGDIVTDALLLGGLDTVQSSITYTLGATIENLTLTGALAINGTGNALNNVITGNDAINVLSGLDGDDTLNSGVGNDQVTGGNGNDLLNGGTGADTMNGGFGNDTYVVDNAGDIVTDALLLGGLDTVQSSITYTLGATIENLTLTGALASNGTGNALNNIIIGNASNNVFTGGSGADTLTGGLGVDFFDYNFETDSQVGSRDIINDFNGANAGIGDQISLTDIDANGVLAGNGTFTWINSNAFSAVDATGQLRYAGGILQGSTDADAAAEFEIQLIGAPALFVDPVAAGTDILL